MIVDLKPYVQYKESGLLLNDDTQMYEQFVENESFRRFVGDMVYAIASQ